MAMQRTLGARFFSENTLTVPRVLFNIWNLPVQMQTPSTYTHEKQCVKLKLAYREILRGSHCTPCSVCRGTAVVFYSPAELAEHVVVT